MGEKGSRLTKAAEQAAERAVAALAGLGEVRSRKMFGGYGLFEGDAVFALVDSEGALFLKADSTTQSRFLDLGSRRHGKMPYFEVPPTVKSDAGALHQWASDAVTLAHKGKK